MFVRFKPTTLCSPKAKSSIFQTELGSFREEKKAPENLKMLSGPESLLSYSEVLAPASVYLFRWCLWITVNRLQSSEVVLIIIIIICVRLSLASHSISAKLAHLPTSPYHVRTRVGSTSCVGFGSRQMASYIYRNNSIIFKTAWTAKEAERKEGKPDEHSSVLGIQFFKWWIMGTRQAKIFMWFCICRSWTFLLCSPLLFSVFVGAVWQQRHGSSPLHKWLIQIQTLPSFCTHFPFGCSSLVCVPGSMLTAMTTMTTACVASFVRSSECQYSEYVCMQTCL